VYKYYTADYKFFQEHQQKSRRFPVFPGGISNSRRFPVFPVLPGVVDTLLHHAKYNKKLSIHKLQADCTTLTITVNKSPLLLTQSLAPTVLYNNVDGLCDKLVTNDSHHSPVYHNDRPLKLTATETIWLLPTKIEMVHVT